MVILSVMKIKEDLKLAFGLSFLLDGVISMILVIF